MYGLERMRRHARKSNRLDATMVRRERRRPVAELSPELVQQRAERPVVWRLRRDLRHGWGGLCWRRESSARSEGLVPTQGGIVITEWSPCVPGYCLRLCP